MGNFESSSSHSNNNYSDEEQTLAASSAIKLGVAIAGAAALAFAAWILSWSSDSTENKSKDVGVVERGELSRATSCMKDPGSEKEGIFAIVESASRSIKLMSYNVLFREDVDVIKRMEAIGQLIEKHSPDIIFFQEVTPNIYRILQSSQWWKHYKCSVPQKTANRKCFCMLLSKLKVKKIKNVYFQKSTKGIFWAKLDVGSNKNLVVATTHLKSQTSDKTYSSERTSQAKESLNRLNNFPNVVLGGDMNWDEDTDGPFPLHDGWIDPWVKLRPAENGWTYPKRRKRLDRFICKLSDFEIHHIDVKGKEPIRGLSYSHNKKDNPVYPSDHCALLLTIRTK